MIADEIRSLIRARPFKTFTLYIADGRQIPIVHHDFILVSPRGMIVDVFQPNDEHDILDVMNITGIKPALSQSHHEPTSTTNA